MSRFLFCACTEGMWVLMNEKKYATICEFEQSGCFAFDIRKRKRSNEYSGFG